ncbi:MAG: hypothetical protein M1835_003518, partial [Candelina submexicana]
MATLSFTLIIFLTLIPNSLQQTQRFIPFSLINTFPAYSTLPPCATSSIRSVLDPVAACTTGNPSLYASCCCSNDDISASIMNRLSTLFRDTGQTPQTGCPPLFRTLAIGLFNSFCSEMHDLYPATAAKTPPPPTTTTFSDGKIPTNSSSPVQKPRPLNNLSTIAIHTILTPQQSPTRSTCTCKKQTQPPIDPYWNPPSPTTTRPPNLTLYPPTTTLFTSPFNHYPPHTHNSSYTSTSAPDPGNGGGGGGGEHKGPAAL